MATKNFTVRMITSYEISIAVDTDEYDDPEKQEQVAYERAVERRDEKPGPRSWAYHDQVFRVIG